MSFSLPDIPENLTANNVAKKITELNYADTKKIYDVCIDMLRCQRFPCMVDITTDKNAHIPHIVEKLTQAGYTVKVEEKEEQEYDYQNQRQYNVIKKFIMIDNPFVKPLP